MVDCSKVSNATPSVVQAVNFVYFLNPDQFVQIASQYGVNNFNPLTSLPNSSSSSGSSSSSLLPTTLTRDNVGYYKNIVMRVAQLVGTLPGALVDECLVQLYKEPKLVDTLKQYYTLAKVLPSIVYSIQPKVITINMNNTTISNLPPIIKKNMMLYA